MLENQVENPVCHGKDPKALRKRWCVLLLVLIFLIPLSAYACEPLIPLLILFAPPATLGGFLLTSVYGFLLIVAIKCGAFIWKSDFKSLWAILYFVVANVASTVVGIVVSSMFSASMFLIIGVFVLYAVFLLPARRLREFRQFSTMPRKVIAFLLTIIALMTVFLYGLMEWFMEVRFLYWPLKIVLSILAIGLSLIISILYEETIISELYRKFQKRPKSFMRPVIWCNILILFVVAVAGAAIALPKRLASPDFFLSPSEMRQE